MADLAELLRTIAEHAGALRDAGIEGRVRVGDVEFSLVDKREQQSNAPAEDSSPKNALDDPSTYGFAAGSSLPGFTDPRKADR